MDGRHRFLRKAVSCMVLPLATKKLLKDNSTGSLASIYDDNLSVSSAESGSDYSPDPISRLSAGIEEELECLSTYPWFVGKLSRLESEQCLEGMRNGTYLVRLSEGRSGYTHAIAIRWRDQTSHIRIYKTRGTYTVSHHSSHAFHSIEEVVSHFQRHSLVTNFAAVNTTLEHPYREELQRLKDLSYEDYADELPEYSDPDIPLVQDDHQCVNPHIPLEEQPWYHGKLARNEAEQILADKPDFSFLLRDSESVLTGYSLSIRDTHGGFIHLRVICQAGGYVLGQYSHLFENVPECIAFYCQEKLNIKGARQETLMNPVSRLQ